MLRSTAGAEDRGKSRSLSGLEQGCSTLLQLCIFKKWLSLSNHCFVLCNVEKIITVHVFVLKMWKHIHQYPGIQKACKKHLVLLSRNHISRKQGGYHLCLHGRVLQVASFCLNWQGSSGKCFSSHENVLFCQSYICKMRFLKGT